MSDSLPRPDSARHGRHVLLVACLFLLAPGCGGGDDPTNPGDDNPTNPPVPLTLQPSELCSANPDSAVATFEDASLESAVRRALLVGSQVIVTCGMVSGVTEVSGRSTGVESLVGIQNLTNLVDLDLTLNTITDVTSLAGLTSLTNLSLFNNFVSDITPLSGLTNLTDLGLAGNLIGDNSIDAPSELTSLTFLDLRVNLITDVSALSELTILTQLRLEANSITDISALSGLTQLTGLWLFTNSIANISALSRLTSLTDLDLHANSITDVSAARELTSLTFLGLFNNPNLTDIQPLLDNAGLGMDDQVDLKSTSVSCASVTALEAKGVTVSSDCP